MNPTQPQQLVIDQIRSASRRIVRELGFMRSTLAMSRHSASAVHAVVEIGLAGSLSASQLTDKLQLEKSTVSRLVRKLTQGGELLEQPCPSDGRTKLLALSPSGQQLFAQLQDYGRGQVGGALVHLSAEQQRQVEQGLNCYAAALEARHAEHTPPAAAPIAIETGYRCGALGSIVAMHARYYHAHAGFGAFFERQVATGLADFLGRLSQPGNQLWLALRDGRIIGSLVIAAEPDAPGQAQLRWFILNEEARGSGLGRRMMEQAMAFCDQQRLAVRLWTFQGLLAARHLYEAFGFVLSEERPGARWGEQVVEQCFTRPAKS